MQKYWLYENGYWEGREEEMQAGAVEVPKRPYACYSWDGTAWNQDMVLAKTEIQSQVLSELKRIEKFLLLPAAAVSSLRIVLDGYVAELRALVNAPPADMAMPEIPAELSDEAFFA